MGVAWEWGEVGGCRKGGDGRGGIELAGDSVDIEVVPQTFFKGLTPFIYVPASVVASDALLAVAGLLPTSARTGTTLEEDQAELELVGEIWCRLGKERLRRGMKRGAEECCGYVTELLPKVILTSGK